LKTNILPYDFFRVVLFTAKENVSKVSRVIKTVRSSLKWKTWVAKDWRGRGGVL